jgi:hypothetical protein
MEEEHPSRAKPYGIEGSLGGLCINTELKSGAEQDERTDPQKQPEKPPCQATLAAAEKKKILSKGKIGQGTSRWNPQEPVTAGVYATGRSRARSALVEPRLKRGTARHEKNRA